ncbi:unnamed protein product [Paramecium octaurelia]|uniref:Uncharacterized protein n=1 Tax=Paramecium octaurelia TaxID=43137 RepID=A0A8S1YSS2_PAROT|nr:unnamed protein product [Paramecium octaurelia]
MKHQKSNLFFSKPINYKPSIKTGSNIGCSYYPKIQFNSSEGYQKRQLYLKR